MVELSFSLLSDTRACWIQSCSWSHGAGVFGFSIVLKTGGTCLPSTCCTWGSVLGSEPNLLYFLCFICFSMISNNTQWQRWHFHTNFIEEEINFKEIKYLVQWTKSSKCRTILRYIKLLANNYISNAYHVLGFILGAGKMAMNRTDKKAALLELMF